VPSKRPTLRYLILTFLLVITVAYEGAYWRTMLRLHRFDFPIVAMKPASNELDAKNSSTRVDLKTGDRLLAVNGVPYRGEATLYSAFNRARLGVPILLEVESKGSIRTVALPVTPTHASFWEKVASAILNFLLPALCLLLGFWVVAVRPHDFLAWLLLALMMTIPQLFENYIVQGWPVGWRELAMVYHSTLGYAFTITMFFFGRYFPEPFPPERIWDKVWKIMQWVLVAPFAVLQSLAIIISVGELDHYQAVAPLTRYFSNPFIRIVPFALISTFFAAIFMKYSISKSADVKRRLRILYWGATVAWTPAFFIAVYASFLGQTKMDRVVPEWAVIIGFSLLNLFPLTLAYVIVVQKAMDVRVVLRQGLQYTFATSGVRIIQIIAVIVLVIAAVGFLGDSGHSRVLKIGAMLVGIAILGSIGRVSHNLRVRIDKRFFREAYNAEQVLTELSEQVRSMVEPKSLLQTVASRIAETLHVPRIAVLLGNEIYRPAYALGEGDVSSVEFSRATGTVKVLQREKAPAMVYPKDRDSWIYRESDVSEKERADLSRLESELLLPLAVRDKLLGFISLGAKRSEEPYTGTDVRLLKSVAAQTGLALENADLMRTVAEEVAQRERLNREVEIAREVQERLFPQTLPPITGLDYAGHCRPALGVGGDYYDFLALPQGHLGVAIGDVSGKGIAAALMMASLQASLRGEATRGPENLAVAIGNINRLVYEASSANRYATFFYGQYDPATRKFDYVNAGHNPPMIFHCSDHNAKVTRLDVGGTVVGLLESFAYEQGSVSLQTGDTLVAFTDGISEAMNSADEEWGEDRMMAAIKQCDGMNADQLMQQIFLEADKFVAGAKQHDDMTVVILRVL
jgi:sigma-B regulation protein RsbU (phosphoserine phosphatase)